MSERKRSKNFTDKEAMILISLISESKSILENKKTDAINNQTKYKTWEKVANNFNATCPEGAPRNAESIKKWWDNKKRIIRKEKGEERKEIFLTGGGPAPPKADPQSDIILSILDPETVLGGEGPFGSDAGIYQNAEIYQKQNSGSKEDDYFCYELEVIVLKPQKVYKN